ncbi:MAG: hypothetical protein Q9187_001632 [Circinaria calcarea]
MPRDQTKSNAQRNGRQSSVLKSLANKGKQPRGIQRKQLLKPVRKSTRLQEIQRKTPERKPLFPSPSTTNSFGEEILQDPSALENPPNSDRKRKRSQEAEDPLPRTGNGPCQKRPRTLLANPAVEDTSKQEAKGDINKKTQPIKHWIREGSWPKEYSEQDSQTREDLERYNCLKDFLIKQEINMADILARKKSSSSLRRKDSESSLATPSDQQPREAKSSKYMTAAYETVLATKGSYMGRTPLKITDISKTLCRSLLITEQTVPQETLFRDDLFDETCDSVRSRNEAIVVRHISPLICPSPLVLQIYGAKGLDCLTESVNEGWNSAIPVVYSRPQPDHSVGFARSAFTDEQLEKLKPLVGEIEDLHTSYFMGTWRMYFPFLTCEVKCGAAALDVADRQNAHSMTIAVRAVVQLYRHVKREKEIHLEILAFSISHDDQAVRIYGHYPVIDGDKTTYYRHPIHEFYFTALEGKEKWTAYKFTKNVYDVWMPTHLKRICSAIDDIPPDLDFGVSLGDSFTSVASAENESELPDSQEMATSAPASQDTERMKKPRLTATAMLREQLAQRDQQLAQRDQQLMESLKQLTPLNASSGNESMLQQEIDRLREQMAQRDEQFMHLLKQQTPSNASATESELQREHDGQQQEIERQKQEMKKQAASSNARIDQLIRQNKKLMSMLKQRIT